MAEAARPDPVRPVDEFEEFEFRRRLELEQAGGMPASQPAAPTMGQVARQAVPKGLANFLQMPITIADLIMQGIASLPGAGHLQGLQRAEQEPELKARPATDLAVQAGVIDPTIQPQTGPQRIVDVAIQAATAGAAGSLAGGVTAMAQSAAVAGVSGAAAQTTKELTGSDLLAAVVGVASPVIVRSLSESGKKIILTKTGKATLKEAQEAGFVVEPSSVRQPSSALESVAGKPAIAQDAVFRNQQTANRLAAKALGLPDDAALSPDVLDVLKQEVGKVYNDVDALRANPNMPWFPRFHQTNLLSELKQARQDRSALWKAYWRQPDEGVRKAALAAEANVQSLEADIANVAQAAGRADLLPRLDAARQLYARISDVEQAMNPATGNVSMPVLAKMFDDGRPLSGELRTIGRFANAFKRVAREVETTPPPGVSATNVLAGAALGAEGAAVSGSPAGLAAAGLPLVRKPARERVLSPQYQKGLLKEPAPPASPGVTAGRSAIVGATVAEQED